MIVSISEHYNCQHFELLYLPAFRIIIISIQYISISEIIIARTPPTIIATIVEDIVCILSRRETPYVNYNYNSWRRSLLYF